MSRAVAARRTAARAAMLAARRQGATLREAAAAAGVHVATVCRWQARDPELRDALAEAAEDAREQLRPPRPRPPVRWRRDCPLCRAKVVIRSAAGRGRFWRCGRWPRCPWASWRPRAPRDCPRCGAYRVWSHSRKSVVCTGCGLRTGRALGEP
ncbi:MAG TPA: helix-turn-helix domain-containing protein [Gemmataceae bacterium]|jgi:hypothetical protein